VPYLGVGNADAGRELVAHFGCGSCHVAPGVAGADARVGPSLAHLGEQSYIAGVIANTPDDLVRWLMDPPAVKPGTVMPNLGLSRRDASDIAAYLLSLR
jgi:cytochrome c2